MKSTVVRRVSADISEIAKRFSDLQRSGQRSGAVQGKDGGHRSKLGTLCCFHWQRSYSGRVRL